MFYAADAGPSEHSTVNVSVQGGRRRVEAATHTVEGVGGTVVVMRDATAIESLHADLQLAAQPRALATIYRVLLHDAKAPLNAIVLNMDMLRETLEHPPDDGEGLQERQLRYIETVGREIGRVNRSLKGGLFVLPASFRIRRKSFVPPRSPERRTTKLFRSTVRSRCSRSRGRRAQGLEISGLRSAGVGPSRSAAWRADTCRAAS